MKEDIGTDEFYTKLPDNDSCLENLFMIRFGRKPCEKCGQHTKFYRIKKRKCFQFPSCQHQVYPMKGTIMENSTTDLRKWMGAIYHMVISKNGISAKEMQRHIKVTYKCAFRMCHKIRGVMEEDNLGILRGTVEVDETYIGGKLQNREKDPKFNFLSNKTIVLGMYQWNGKIKLRKVKNTGQNDLFPHITTLVETGSTIYSDEHAPYKKLPNEGYKHDFITHKKKEWARGKVTTNRIEGCWSRFKNTIRGTYISIGAEHMESYLREVEFRNNNRKLTTLERFLKVLGFVGFDFQRNLN